MLARWLTEPEGEHLEFKEARRQFSKDSMCRYLAALANSGGGHLVLGVSDTKPRRVTGTDAIRDHAVWQHEISRTLGLQVRFTELAHADGRVFVASVGRHHVGVPVQYRGEYLIRAGESLVAMTTDQLRKILDQVLIDYSAEPIPGANIDDLDMEAVVAFQVLWANRAGRLVSRERKAEISAYRPLEVVERASLVSDRGVTVAALVLLGSEAALDRFLPQHEIIYEYREQEGHIHNQIRVNLRRPFILAFKDIWELINVRNNVIDIPSGMLRTSVRTFNEEVVREGLMNAVAHRDYRTPESVFLRHYPLVLRIQSPGGFPDGVTAENILDRQVPRNRLIAESLERCGLVERSGQGADIMFRESIREAKMLPSFEGTDEYQVNLTLSGVVEDPDMLRVMDAIARENIELFDVRDYLILDAIERTGVAPKQLAERIPRLVQLGVLERLGRGRLILSRRLHAARGRKGAYTRKRGLERPAQQELIIQHLRDAGERGAAFREFAEMFPGHTRAQIHGLLNELRSDERVHVQGMKRNARWYLGPIDGNAG